jgi:hypothetical protein
MLHKIEPASKLRGSFRYEDVSIDVGETRICDLYRLYICKTDKDADPASCPSSGQTCGHTLVLVDVWFNEIVIKILVWINKSIAAYIKACHSYEMPQKERTNHLCDYL